MARGAQALAIAEELDDPLATRFELQAARGQHFGGEAALFTEQPEQQVLGPDVIV